MIGRRWMRMRMMSVVVVMMTRGEARGGTIVGRGDGCSHSGEASCSIIIIVGTTGGVIDSRVVSVDSSATIGITW